MRTDMNYAAKIVGISRSPLMAQVMEAVDATRQATSSVGHQASKAAGVP